MSPSTVPYFGTINLLRGGIHQKMAVSQYPLAHFRSMDSLRGEIQSAQVASCNKKFRLDLLVVFLLWDFLLSYHCRRYLNKVYSCFSVARERRGGTRQVKRTHLGQRVTHLKESLFGGLPLLFSSPGKWNGRTLAHHSLAYKKIPFPKK